MSFETNVLEVIQRTYNVKSFRFFRPEQFEFKPGQYISVNMLINGKEEKRFFSISSSPTQKRFFEFTQKLTDNDFSVALGHLKKGDCVMVDGAFGSFTFEGEFPKVVMLAGGVGVTPYRSMIKYCVEKKVDTDIVLLYSNRTESDILFKKEFDLISNQQPNIKTVYTLTKANTPWTGYTRRIDKKMILDEVSDFKERIFFICGPPKFVTSMENILDELKVDTKNIREEKY